MRLYRKLIISCLFIAMTSLLSAEAEMVMDPCPNDHPIPYRRYSKELLDVNRELLYDLDEAAYARMSLENPLLKLAYRNVFTRSMGVLDQLQPAEAMALADMRSRGEAVSPMLLKLLEENQETGFETSLLGNIDQVKTVSIDLFIEYARNLLKNRTQTMNASLAGSAAILLSRHGSKDDVDLLKSVMEQRPYVADSVTRELDELLRRLEQPTSQPRPTLKGRSQTSDLTSEGTINGKQITSSETRSGISPSNTWIPWIFLGMMLIGTGYLLLKNSNKQRR